MTESRSQEQIAHGVSKLRSVGLVGICLAAMMAIVACPLDDSSDDSSNDATLTNLEVTGADVTFVPGTTLYTASVSQTVDSITVTPTAAAGASYMITAGDMATLSSGGANAAAVVDLGVGTNTITITVTAENDSTELTYTVTVNREAPDASDDATLRVLTLTQRDGDIVNLMEDFAPGTTSYTASVPRSVASVTVTATPTDNNARVTTIFPADHDNDENGHQVNLGVGVDTEITIMVTAADNLATMRYTVTINRSTASSDIIAPTFMILPIDRTTNVAIDANIVIRADEPIRMTDGAEITDGTIAGLITLMETPRGSSTAAVKPFTATINIAKRILTIDPTDDFANGSSVSVSLARVEDTAGNDSADPAIEATFTVVPTIIDISGRTQAVQDAILATNEVTETDRTTIPSPQLAAITSLTVSGLSSLMADDFANLSGLTELDLSGNTTLTTLPSSIFDDLLDTLTILTLDTALQGTVDFATASGDIDLGAMVELSVTLTTALPTEVQISYAVSFANSADAADFSGLADGMVTFAAGSTNAQSIAVTATATADLRGTATLTLGTPVLTADIRDPSPLVASSLVSVGSTAAHTLTVLGRPNATLSVTDDSVTEQTHGEELEAIFTLALTNLPTNGADDISVLFTMSGFAGEISGGNDTETRLHTFATTTGVDKGVGPRDLDGTAGTGRIELDRSDGDIDADGSSTVDFRIRLLNDDGNIDDETITLTIDCVARSRTGTGRAGCISAGAGNIISAQDAVGDAIGGNGASITVTDDEVPMATLSVTDNSVTEQTQEPQETQVEELEAIFTLALTNMPTDGADDVSVFFSMSGFAGEISAGNDTETRLHTFATTTGVNGNVGPHNLDGTAGTGRIELDGSDGDIDADGSSTVDFRITLQKDDGNVVNETITLTINCVARSRTGAGLAGCIGAGAGNTLVAGDTVGGTHPASITVTDDDEAPEGAFSVTDGILDELAASNTSGFDATFTLSLANLPTDGADDVSVFFTMSGFVGTIGSQSSHETRLHTFATTTGTNVGIGPHEIGNTPAGAGRIELDRSDGDIDADGISHAIFRISLRNDDGNEAHETITLTIDCVARSRTGQGEAGCTSAGSASILVAGSAVVGNEASIIGVDNTPFKRIPSRDFNTLHAAENDFPRGIWSDGTTMWVVNDASFGADNKIFAYNLITKERDSSKDFNTLIAAGNRIPRGIWSDDATMWVANDGSGVDNKIFAYNLITKERDSSKDFNTLATAGNLTSDGIWSNDATMWVVNSFSENNKIFAYNLNNKNRDSGRDFNTLDSSGNDYPRGIWSNGTTMWVANNGSGANDKIFAYTLTNKNRDSGKDFNTLDATGNDFPTGIWSDGTTMWVANDGGEAGNKIYAYRMP